MIWLTWRQFRTQAVAVLALLIVATVYFVITGLSMRHTYSADLAACAQPNSQCQLLLNEFQGGYQSALEVFRLFMLAMPALIGIFWGAPLIATEYERGTHQLVWNQSVTPTRWLSVKLAGVGLAAVVTSGGLSLLLTWWAGPLDQLANNRFDWNTFGTSSVVPLAYAAFAFAFGAALGLFVRRALPAMALTLAVFVALQLLFALQIRPNLLPSSTATETVDAATLGQSDGIRIGGGTGGVSIAAHGPAGSWLLHETPVEDSAGHAVTATQVSHCFHLPLQPMSQLGACLAPDNLHIGITYLAAADYWPLQWYESAIYLVLAAVCCGVCFWRIHRYRN